ncbi:MAG: LPS-assembly protein LptD [Acidobacteria bacterium]|nr:LPS-assembly protein LptD [Acidobacteriota bacterium]
MRSTLITTALVAFFFDFFLEGQDRARLEFPYKSGEIIIQADRLIRESATLWMAEGDVVVTYQGSTLTASRIEYNPVLERVRAEGNIEVKRGVQWLKGSRAELNLKNETGVLEDVEGFTDEEFFVRARRLFQTGPNQYVAENGFLTACKEALPKWSFTVQKARIRLDSTTRLNHTLFRVKSVPVFYLPFVMVPNAKKERSSGFLLPSTGTSSNKGRRISQSFYLVLGRSADVMLHGDYFSERGFGYGMSFRMQPNAVSRLQVDGYLVDDRKDQGGASVNAIGETHFSNGFRAVADFSLVSNFLFRQIFSDNFYAATRPNENSRVFVTNNFRSSSFNFLISGEQTVLSDRSVVVRNTPLIDLKLLGHRLLDTPFYLELDASLEGLSRNDQILETPGLIQRIDFFSQLYTSLPLLQGLRLSPRLGLRHTFYSDSLDENLQRLTGENINRQYVEFSAQLQGWGMSRVYGRSGSSAWKHLIEPVVEYRYIGGLDEFQRIVRFNERDAVANTHEVEYALVNRLFQRKLMNGVPRNHEWLSVRIAQKHFFDPDFGGAFQENSVNQFYPLYTLTGFHYAAVRRDFSPVSTLVRLSPEPRVSFEVRSDYDTRFHTFRNFSVTGFLNSERLSVGTTYFLTEKLERGTFENNQLQAQIALGNLQRGPALSTSFTYDTERSRFLNSMTRLHYVWDCCAVSLEYQQFDLGVRQERQLRFSFSLKGIGTFGTIKRPETVFSGTVF